MTTEPAPPTVDALMELVSKLSELAYDSGIEFVASGGRSNLDAEAETLYAIRDLASSLAAPPSDRPAVALDGVVWRDRFGVELVVNPDDPRAAKGTPVYTLAAATTSPTESGLASKAIASPASPTAKVDS